MHVVITGITGGIGQAMAKIYCERQVKVTGLCRRPMPELEELGCELFTDFDVTDPVCHQKAFEALGPDSVDILINNAGVLVPQTLDHLDPEGIRKQFEVNALGPLLLTHALLPSLKKGAKVAMISSRMGSIEDNTSGGAYGYRASKVALNMFSRSLAHDLAPEKIWVGILHPGYVRTKMTGNNGLIDPEVAAAGLIKLIDEASQETSGTFWHSNGSPLPW